VRFEWRNYIFQLTNYVRLAAFDASDKARRVREDTLNNLEAFAYRARDHLEDEAFIAVSTDEARSTLEEKLSAASDWIYAEGHDATHEALKAKLKELEDIVKPILRRKTEAAGRPEAIKEFESNLADVKTAIDLVKLQIHDQETKLSQSAESASAATASSTESAIPSASADPLAELEEDADASTTESSAVPEPTPVDIIYTEEDLEYVQGTHANASKWWEEKQAAQKTLKESDDPAVTVKELKAETQKLSSVVIQMMMKKSRVLNAPKTNKPKAKPKAKKPKPSKKAKDEKPAKEPTQEELEEALEKAGIKKDSIKFKKFDYDKEIKDKDGRLLTKLELGEDATEEDIKAAIDRAMQAGKERQGEEKKESEKAAKVTGGPHDEL